MTTLVMDGKSQIPEELSLLMLVKGNKLLVSEQSRRDMLVISWIERLKQQSSISAVEYISVDEMNSEQKKQNDSLASQGDADNDEQKEIINIIKSAIAEGASDIHITVNDVVGKTFILFRINGVYDRGPRLIYSAKEGMNKMRCIYQAMSDVSNPQFRLNEAQASSMDREKLPDSLYGVRIEHSPILNGHYMVGRLMYKGGALKDYSALGFEDDQIKTLDWLARLPYGIVIFAGVTGSGKSTTLACSLYEVYKFYSEQVNIITVEDPVEFILPWAHQIPVAAEKDKRAQCYLDAINSMMRLDPDVGMISELRDYASIMAAIDLALTGHQLWTSFHATDVVSVLPRLEMKGIPRETLADNKLVTGIISQSLVKKLCPHCSIPFADYQGEDKANIDHMLSLTGVPLDNVRFNGAGCDHPECRDGYIGRTVLAQVVPTDPTFMKFFLEGNRLGMRQHLRAMKYMTKHEHARLKIARGMVDVRDVEMLIGPINADFVEEDLSIEQNEIINSRPLKR